MKIQNIQPNNFEAKDKFITPKMSNNIRKILTLMNQDKTRVLEGDYFKVSVIKKLIHNNTSFEDQCYKTNNIPQESIMNGLSTLKIGKISLEIDNKTGKIFEAKKPFYKPWFYVLKQAENVLDTLFRNFYNPKTVKKEIIRINEPTPETNRRIKQMVLKAEKQHLESVVKKLEEELKDAGR